MAVVLVLIAHGSQTVGFPANQVISAIAHRGRIGVEIFFVLSGFLITTLLLREFEKTGTISLRQFYLRRLLRIVPAYAALLLFVAFWQWSGRCALQPRDWLAALTYTMNFVYRPGWELGHVWSLSIEEHFYLIWPLALVALGQRRAWIAAISCIGLCIILRILILLFARELTARADNWTMTRLDTISMGCLLAIAAHSAVWRNRLDYWCLQPWSLAALLVVLVLSCALSISGKWSFGVAYTLNAACIAMILWHVVQRADGWLIRVLNNTWVSAVGACSYSLYLWQQPFLNPHRTAFWTMFPRNLGFAILAAIISYRFIELPMLGLKARIGGNSHGACGAVAARLVAGQLAPESAAQSPIGSRNFDA